MDFGRGPNYVGAWLGAYGLGGKHENEAEAAPRDPILSFANRIPTTRLQTTTPAGEYVFILFFSFKVSL